MTKLDENKTNSHGAGYDYGLYVVLRDAIVRAFKRSATEERMESNANRVLWCVHVIGPDDLYAEPSHAAAVASAAKLNHALWSRENAPNDVTCFAYADTWPWSAEAHAESMAKQAADETAHNAARNASR